MSWRVVRWVLRCSPAWGSDRLVLIGLAYRANAAGEAAVSIEDLQRLTQADRRTVQRCLRNLEAEKHVVRTADGWRVVMESPPPAVPRKRLADGVWAGLREALRYVPATKSEYAVWMKARNEIADALGYRKGGEGYEVVKGEVVRRVEEYRRRYPGAAVTPPALAKHWGELGPPESCLVCGSPLHAESVHPVEDRVVPATDEERRAALARWFERRRRRGTSDGDGGGDAEVAPEAERRDGRPSGDNADDGDGA